jgi:alkylresorcinol/alkylpyrone synthase
LPTLRSIAHAVPENLVLQSELRELAAAVLSEHAPLLTRLLPVFDHAGIESRHFVEPLPWYLEPHGWKDRSERYLAHAMTLGEEAISGALRKAALAPSDIDTLAVVSTTGIATPSLDARLADRMGFRRDVRRVPVWGLGCAGGVGGLSRGAAFAKAEPESRVLVLALEICSLAFQFGAFSKAVAVAVTLFGDGAAAAVIEGDEISGVGPRLGTAASHLFPRSERIMGWDVEDYGLAVVFSPEIPALVETSCVPLIQEFLKSRGGRAEADRWLLHPGGAKVIEAYERGLSLSPHALGDTRAVLREFGNMSSPTALFVAERSLERAPLKPGERALLAALGPGFASELLLLEGA